MARDISTLKIQIDAEDNASAKLARVEGRFGALGKTLSSGLALGIGAATAAMGGLTALLSRSVDAAATAEEGVERLSNALASLGPRAEGVRDALVAQAEALQKVTKYEDDAIIAGQAFAAGFIKSEDTLKRVTQAAVDLSAGLGLDLQTAFQLLTKASQGNTSALSRYGIVIDETIPKSERFAAVLALANDRFGGRAAADAQTYAGEVTKLGHAFGDLEEAIGGTVTGSTAATQTIRDLTAVVSGAAAATQAAAESEGTWTEAILRASGPLGNIVANYRTLQNARAEAAAAASKEAQEEASLMAQKVAFSRQMIQLLTAEAAARDVNAAAQVRASRIEADAIATKDVLIDAARSLGITLQSETAAGIEKARLEVEALEDAWRRGVTTAEGFRVTAEDVTRAQEALAKMLGESAQKTDTQTQAFESAVAAATEYSRTLDRVVPKIAMTSRAFDELSAAQGRSAAVAEALENGGTLSMGGTRVELHGGGSRLTSAAGFGGTYGSQQRSTTTGTKTYIYNPQSGRVEQYG